MSDALTDSARDSRRGWLYTDYISNLISYLKEQSEDKLVKVKEAAKATDDIRGGWGRKTNLSEKLLERTDRLIKGDKKEWANLLFEESEEPHFKELKKLSPFKDRLLICPKYLCGGIYLKGKGEEIEDFLEKIISVYHKMEIRGGHSYFVSLPQIKPEDTEVVQVD